MSEVQRHGQSILPIHWFWFMSMVKANVISVQSATLTRLFMDRHFTSVECTHSYAGFESAEDEEWSYKML